MQVTIPEKTAEVCDFCHCEGPLQECHVCKRQFCISHSGFLGLSWGFLTLCRECVEREDVQRICERYAKQLTPIFQERNAVLKRLGRKPSAVKAGGNDDNGKQSVSVGPRKRP
jgi:hypothetical protein